MVKKLPISVEYFDTLRENNYFYVDKTSFLVKLLDEQNALSVTETGVIMFNRPRRFGKTLNLTTLATFLDISRDSRDLFADLEVIKHEALCQEWQNQWPVLFVTFKNFAVIDFSGFISNFRQFIRVTSAQYSFLRSSSKVPPEFRKYLDRAADDALSDNELPHYLDNLCAALYYHYGKRVAVIIDEYDVPLSHAHNTEYWKQLIAFMRTCLDFLKTNEMLKFAILSGCLRLAGENLFTGLNNFICYGVDNPNFAEDFGFTEQEVKELLARSGQAVLFAELKEWYNGYHIGDVRIFSPWDTINYLSDKMRDPLVQPQYYWANTSSNDNLRAFIQARGRYLRSNLETLFGGNSIEVNFKPNLTYNTLFASDDNFWTLLWCTGYLTLKENTRVLNHIAQLVLPNREIKEVLAGIVQECFDHAVRENDLSPLYKAFFSGCAAEVEELVTAYIRRSISYFDYSEKFYHAAVLGLFGAFKGSVSSNPESGLGRPDLVVCEESSNTALIIEIKAAKREAEIDALLQAALKQIDEQQYAQKYCDDDWQILKCALVFHRKNCRAAFALDTD